MISPISAFHLILSFHEIKHIISPNRQNLFINRTQTVKQINAVIAAIICTSSSFLSNTFVIPQNIIPPTPKNGITLQQSGVIDNICGNSRI